MKSRIALFDFCDTVVSKQTADDFVFFALEDIYGKISIKKYIARFALKSINLCHRLGIFEKVCPKFILLHLLKGCARSDILISANKYAEILRANYLIRPVYEELVLLSKRDYRIIIVSAGYSAYIDFFFKDLNVEVLANEFCYENDIFRGSIEKNDCIGVEKLNRIYEVVKSFDFDSSFAYSDSDSDIPMLKMVKNAVVVSKAESQKWVAAYGFKEVVW